MTQKPAHSADTADQQLAWRDPSVSSSSFYLSIGQSKQGERGTADWILLVYLPPASIRTSLLSIVFGVLYHANLPHGAVGASRLAAGKGTESMEAVGRHGRERGERGGG